MYRAIVDKPMHKSPLRRHHVRILLRRLPRLLLSRQLGPRVSWSFLAKSGAMGWRVEFGGFLEDEWFGGFLARALVRSMPDEEGACARGC